MTSFLEEDCTLRQGLEKMRYHGYTAIPVLNSEGEYVGTLSEGDFLWSMVDRDDFSMRAQEDVRISEILKHGCSAASSHRRRHGADRHGYNGT